MSEGLKAVSAALVVFTGLALSACGEPMLIEGCESTADIKVYCGLDKPEDLEPLGEHPWLLIAELGDFSGEGRLSALNLDTDALIELTSTSQPDLSFPQCGDMPTKFRPRGFHVSDLADGGFRLLVVNAGQGERIERYRVDVEPAGPALAWQGCVAVPDTVFPNDVASTGGDGFVVSHMYDGPRGTWLTIKFLLGIHTGHAAAWDAQTGWRKVEGSEASFPNGVEADAKTGRVFIGSTYGQTLVAADLSGGNAKVARIPVQSDNITVAPDGRILSVGHTGVPLFGTAGCRESLGQPCSFPFAVVALDPVTLDQEIIYEHREGLIPGASVALSHDGFLYMGTVFGDRISRVKLP
ncbi:MAG: hypothetical protein RIF37_05645 [Rhodospirillaceae bacterium]